MVVVDQSQHSDYQDVVRLDASNHVLSIPNVFGIDQLVSVAAVFADEC